jgi:hypothetical protein
VFHRFRVLELFGEVFEPMHATAVASGEATLLTQEWIHISAGASVLVIGIILVTTIAASVWAGRRHGRESIGARS